MLVVLAGPCHACLELLAVCRVRVTLIALAGSVGNRSLLVSISLASFVRAFTAAHLVRNVDLLRDAVPDGVDAVTIAESLENAITTYHDEVEVVLHLEAFDVRLANDDVRVATVPRPLSFNVTKCLRHGEATREDAQRTLHVQVLLARMSGSFRECLRAIDLASGRLYSYFLQFIVGLVVTTQHANLLSSIDRHDGSRVTDIDDVDHLVDDHDDGCARARPLRTNRLSGHQVLSPRLGLLNE